MTTAATNGRATHCHYIKDSILHYLRPSDSTELCVPIVSKLEKSERGLKDKATARFLIPRSCLDEFEKSPER